MKGLGVSAKTASILFLLAVLFISLALSSYTFLVSNKTSSLPVIEGSQDMSKNRNLSAKDLERRAKADALKKEQEANREQAQLNNEYQQRQQANKAQSNTTNRQRVSNNRNPFSR
jgi:hypothetical protein